MLKISDNNSDHDPKLFRLFARLRNPKDSNVNNRAMFRSKFGTRACRRAKIKEHKSCMRFASAAHEY